MDNSIMDKDEPIIVRSASFPKNIFNFIGIIPRSSFWMYHSVYRHYENDLNEYFIGYTTYWSNKNIIHKPQWRIEHHHESEFNFF